MTENRQECLDAGCNDFVAKPIDRTNLIAMIRTYASSGDAAISSQESPPDVFISELTDDDVLEVVEAFETRLPNRIAAIERAIGERDTAALSTLAHQLKGAAGGYGFPATSDAVGLLESSARTGESLETLSQQTRSLRDLCRAC